MGLGRYDRSPDASPHARAERRRANKGGSGLSDAELQFGYASEWSPAWGLAGCWCHGEMCRVEDGQHLWPGKARGLGHPRNKIEAAIAAERDLEEGL